MGPARENLLCIRNNKGTDQPAQSDQCNCDSQFYWKVSYSSLAMNKIQFSS